MNAAIEPSRLYQVLSKTGLLRKDPVLYQLLYNLIGNIVKLTANQNAAGGSGSGGGSTTTINNLYQIIESLGSEEHTTEYMMIASGTTGSTPAATTYDAPLTNGDALIPELIFDSNGDVVMVTGIPLP